MRLALACGCGLSQQLLILRDASAVVLAPLATEPATTWDDDRFAAEMASGMSDYERFLSPLKAALFADAGGAVLELGCGTGPSLRFFGRASSVTGVEPNLAMHPLARASADAAGLGDRFRLVTGNAEDLPFEDASFDTVVGASHLDFRCRMSMSRIATSDASMSRSGG
jgi:SAM-dependent methyltransferase